ncbi:hypothetical protein Pan153_28380 [Gimesia panareensis]|uniref:Uncharacterized protein n=1 Tax=Gimesia panareensis TaxID=2527978 RepID=A0A518FP99_9PLAN|nr:hypothetical protein Pan153_28380 [Gimesia panareensis]
MLDYVPHSRKKNRKLINMFSTAVNGTPQNFFRPSMSFSAGKTAFDFGLKNLKKFLAVSV